MYDTTALIEQVEDVLKALERIPRRFAGIGSAEAFEQSEEGLDRLDAICMTLIAAGEAFRQIDRKTEGRLRARYPEVDWRGVIGYATSLRMVTSISTSSRFSPSVSTIFRP